MPYAFDEIGRLPTPGDNVAIATRRLEAGDEIAQGNGRYRLSSTVLEGHRFAVKTIAPGDYLYSWGMPFGTATRRLESGDYACNEGVLEALGGRDIDFALPDQPNFSDDIPPFVFEADGFTPSDGLPPIVDDLQFEGIDRGIRGVGTRNFIVIMAASSRASGFVRRLAAECQDFVADFPNIDGIVPVAHTEGDDERQFNLELVLRTLAGFFVHPNVGAMLVVDVPGAAANNRNLQEYMARHGYPMEEVPHAFISLDGGLEQRFAESKSEIVSWLAAVNRSERTPQPAGRLNIALQCGGSDAFSGISGNPLAGWVARSIIRRGGRANLAETDELIGAESYVLQRLRGLDTAERFLQIQRRFIEIAERHGSSAAGNPSGGNKFRGLYNIYLKSLGAAMKKPADVRLDYAIDYGEPMKAPGYYFMDSPGNDLESIAGQVASGCNLIFFVTGNGSITNFPFVPTVKIVTTTRRYDLLKHEMDVNAGAYLDGTPMDELGEKMLALTLEIASGDQSAGEQAGHAQVQLWRNWRIGSADRPAIDHGGERLSGLPLPVSKPPATAQLMEAARQAVQSRRSSVGLVLPTSLCSGEIARMATERLNATNLAPALEIDRFVSLVHTEGCGVSSGPVEDLFIRTMTGYLVHPNVRYAFLLEHGCEKTHNDFFSRYLQHHDIDTSRFGWASIQRDGGIDNVMRLIETWFREKAAEQHAQNRAQHDLRIGFVLADAPATAMAHALANSIGAIIEAGGSAIVAQPSGHDLTGTLHAALGLEEPVIPTLNYGQAIVRPGYHVMATPALHVQETIAGIGATGVDLIVVVSEQALSAGHPFIPVLQIAQVEHPDIDLIVREGAESAGELLRLFGDTARGVYTPQSTRFGLVDFQMSRGWSGVSL